MTYKYSMRFKLLTLIDITQTNARKGDDIYRQHQHQNYLTAIQTISLRSNPIIKKQPLVEEKSIDTLGFGTKIKGKHKLWTLEVEFESFEQGMETLKNDMDLVPVINNLDESIVLEIGAFLTNGSPYRNTVFIETDK